MKGSVTIEASFIYPILIFYMILLILFLFYSHDRLTAKSDTYTTLITNYFNDNTTFDKDKLSQTLKKHCLLKTNYKITYDNTNSCVNVEGLYGDIFSVSFSLTDKCSFVRKVRFLLNR